MLSTIFLLTILPLIAGFSLIFIRRERTRGCLAFIAVLISLFGSLAAFIKQPSILNVRFVLGFDLIFDLGRLSGLMVIFINLIGLLVVLYSAGYFQVNSRRFFFPFLLGLIGCSNLVCLSADFVSLIFSWGAALGLLYGLLNLGSGYNAAKALSLVGFGDFCLLLGAGLYIYLSKTTAIPETATLVLDNPVCWFSFILMLTGALAKSGCAPFHTWIPDASLDAPIPVMAILPASIDKLLGIYFLAKICTGLFILDSVALAILLFVGSATIMFAVLMALIQHDLRRLLSFHSISQVGYMIIGFGTGIPLGVAAGIFHMINNVIYKTGLFLTAGSVAEQKKVFELDMFGGLAKYMPLTFICGLVFALSISGIPPFNGFTSKWMLYQSMLTGINSTPGFLKVFYLIALVSAMFGSALTLASFIKFIHAVFLGQDGEAGPVKPAEPAINRNICLVVLAILCVLLGLFPRFFLDRFITPWIGEGLFYTGSWDSLAIAVIIMVGLVIGLIVFFSVKGLNNMRKSSAFIGGEDITKEINFTATQFYKTIEGAVQVKSIYRFIKYEPLDLYNILSRGLSVSAKPLYFVNEYLVDRISAICGFAAKKLDWLFKIFNPRQDL